MITENKSFFEKFIDDLRETFGVEKRETIDLGPHADKPFEADPPEEPRRGSLTIAELLIGIVAVGLSVAIAFGALSYFQERADEASPSPNSAQLSELEERYDFGGAKLGTELYLTGDGDRDKGMVEPRYTMLTVGGDNTMCTIVGGDMLQCFGDWSPTKRTGAVESDLDDGSGWR